MFKIYKYLNLKNNVAIPERVRSICNDSIKVKQIYHCKQPEKDDIIDYDMEKKKEIELMFKCPEGHSSTWRNIFLYLCVPVILGFALNNFYLTEEKVKRPKFVEYEHLRIRKKPFPWDPVRTLFHNPRVNALPTGYETEVPEDEEYED